MKKRILIFASLPGLFAASVTSASDDAGMDYPIQLFLRACVSSYSHTEQVAAEAQKMGLDEISGDAASNYLNGRSGRVWYGKNESGAVAVSLLSNGLCTVFMHNGDEERIRAGVESWLPPVGLGIHVSRENLASPKGLTTTAFTMTGGKVREQWVLTIASAPESPLRAMLSYRSL